jgi:septal ring factor EnvC (AmiA/AmiB activator)
MSDDLAKKIAKGALRIEWKDTESAARRVAEYAADRIGELEAENKRLKSMIADVIESTGDDPEIMAASRAEWAARALEAEAKLAKAVEQTLDAASAYLKQQYGLGALSHPVDRGRIIAELKGEK